jgi:hypothetical protein
MSTPLDIVNKNIDAWNRRDIDSRLSTLHFPQYRISGTGSLVEESEEVIGEKWKQALEFAVKCEKWDHSEIDEAKVVHSSDDKVHLSLDFGRYRADGFRYASLKSFWIMTKKDGEWKRTLASNMPLEYNLPEEEIIIMRQRWREVFNR